MSFMKMGVDRKVYNTNRVINFKILVIMLSTFVPAVRVFMGEPETYSVEVQNVYAIYALFCTLLFHYSFNLVVRARVLYTGMLTVYPIAYIMFRQAMVAESVPIFFLIIFGIELLFLHPSNKVIPKFFIESEEQETKSN